MNYNATKCESLALLSLLGYGSANAFAVRSGVDKLTIYEVFGVSPLVRRKRHYILLKIHVALHDSYMEARPCLSKAARKFAIDWAKRWKKKAVEHLLWLENTNDHSDASMKKYVTQRNKRRAQMKQQFEIDIHSLVWR